VERAVVLAEGDLLDAGQFNLAGASGPSAQDPNAVCVSVGTTVGDMERALIMQTLSACEDNRTRAAELLGISVRTLRNKLKEYGEQRDNDED
jgi:DNA-binding NtrC family response regulator